jgi:hypothetical protein
MALRLILFLSLLFPTFAQAYTWVTYDYSETLSSNNTTRAFRLAIPSDYNLVRGLLVNFNGSSGDSRGEYVRKYFANWMRLPEHQFAFVGSIGTELAPNTQLPGEVFQRALASFAVQANRPEITNCPWAFYGFSAGATRGYDVTRTNASMSLGLALISGGVGFNIGDPPPASPTDCLLIPTYMDASKTDVGSITNSNYIFISTNVRSGLLGTFDLIQTGTTHAETWNQHAPGMSWLKSAIKYEYPTNQCVSFGKLTLNRMAKSDGWLIQPAFNNVPFPLITNYSAYPLDKTNNAWWCPDKDAAYVERAFASWDNRLSITAPTTELEVAPNQNITVTVDDSLFVGWTNLALFNFSTNIANKTTGTASFVITNIQPGMYVLSVIGTHAGTNAISQPILVYANILTAPPVSPCLGRVWIASPTGSAGGAGTLASPWDLQTAISSASVQPGDTIYLRGSPGFAAYTHLPQGSIPGSLEGWIFKCTISGTSVAPITIRSYPGEKARIDGGEYSGIYAYHAAARPAFIIGDSGDATKGTDIILQDLEFFSSSTSARFSADTVNPSFPNDYFRTEGPYVYGTRSKIVNCVSHDLSNGLSFWKQASTTEAYGNVTFNNGWVGTPQLHGHGFYTQHNTASGFVTIQRNICLNPYDKNIQMYGSSSEQFSKYRTKENIYLGNRGAGHGGVLLGSRNGGSADRLVDDQVTDNYGFSCDLSLYYEQDNNAYHDVICTGNYFYNCQFNLSSWKSAIITNNYIISPALGGVQRIVDYYPNTPRPPITFLPWTMNYNTYVTTNNGKVFGIETATPTNFAGWQAITGFDTNSTSSFSIPSGTNLTRVYNNAYDANRAQAFSYNWRGDNFVALDVSALGWGTNTSVLVRNVQDYYVDAVPMTTTVSNTIIVNMQASAHTVAIPYGETGGALSPKSFPLFGAWVLEKNGVNTQPPANFVTTIGSVNPNSAVSITVSPNDNSGLGNGSTTFLRTNVSGIVITLTAPSTAGGNVFQKWTRDGSDYSTDTNAFGILYTNVSNSSFVAFYATPAAPNNPYIVSVSSQNPSSGVAITSSPNDAGGLGNGTTGFTRTNALNVITTLTAPSTASGNNFARWERDGVLYTTNAAATFTNVSNVSMAAVYTTPAPPVNWTTAFDSVGASTVKFTISTLDNGGLASGDTPFSRTNIDGRVTSLSAEDPAVVNGFDFLEWLLDGVLYSTSAAITYTNNHNVALTAVYTNAFYSVDIASVAPTVCPVTIFPADNTGASGGSTPLTRVWDTGTIVTLTVSQAEKDGAIFQKWQRSGVDYTTALGATFTNNAAGITYTAVYGPAPIISGGTTFSTPASAAKRGTRY